MPPAWPETGGGETRRPPEKKKSREAKRVRQLMSQPPLPPLARPMQKSQGCSQPRGNPSIRRKRRSPPWTGVPEPSAPPSFCSPYLQPRRRWWPATGTHRRWGASVLTFRPVQSFPPPASRRLRALQQSEPQRWAFAKPNIWAAGVGSGHAIKKTGGRSRPWDGAHGPRREPSLIE